MLDVQPASTNLRRREVARIAGAVIIAALAAGVIVADLDHLHVDVYALAAGGTAIVLLGAWLAEVRIARRLRRIEAQLSDQIDAEHELYIRAYMDGLGGRGK